MSLEGSTSPTAKSSLISWWKQFKTKQSEQEEQRQAGKSSSGFQVNSVNPVLPSDIDVQQQQALYSGNVGSNSRPMLRYKSRSSNYVRPISSSVPDNLTQIPDLRKHRDSYILSQQQKNNNDSQVFGVSLERSLNIAEARISVNTDSPGELIQYGRIPVVVAKCGVFLKNKGLDVEGIFRVGGSSRRVKELQFLFSTPPTYGKKLDWDGYTVHDAASLLRRFLNSLPEPLVPLDMYEKFREPLRSRPRILKYLKHKADKRKADSNTNSASTGTVTSQTAATNNNPVVATENAIGTTTTKSKLPHEDNGLHKHQITKDEELKVNKAESAEKETVEKEGGKVKEDNGEEEEEEEEEEGDGEGDDNDNDSGKEGDKEDEKKLKKKRKLKKHKRLIKDILGALDEYAVLVDNLPVLSKQLLFYVLDLLAIFASHSTKNLMPADNLAAIFQPSILSHPAHDMAPSEYALSHDIVEFLIEYSYKLLPAAQSVNSSKDLTKLASSDKTALMQDEEANDKELAKVPILTTTAPSSTEQQVILTEMVKEDTSLSSVGSNAMVNSQLSFNNLNGNNNGVTSTTSLAAMYPPVSKRSSASRKHSKSLSSANIPPDVLKFSNPRKATLSSVEGSSLDRFISNTSPDEESDDDELPTSPQRQLRSNAKLATPLLSPTADINQGSDNINNNHTGVENNNGLLIPPNKEFKNLNNKKSVESISSSSNSSQQQHQQHQASSNGSSSAGLFQHITRPLSVFNHKDKNSSVDELILSDINGINSVNLSSPSSTAQSQSPTKKSALSANIPAEIIANGSTGANIADEGNNISDDNRTSRWDTGEPANNVLDVPKKETWFKRLRSRSRSGSKRD